MKINEIVDQYDSRACFESTWLSEMPEGIPPSEFSDALDYTIREKIKQGLLPVTDLGDGLKKLEGQQVVDYWYEKSGKILLGAEFVIKPEALVVTMIGKFNKGQPPYASDLYNAVLQDRKQSGNTNAIRIMSDKQLTDQGFSIWQRLLDQGHKISVYNSKNPGQSYTTIQSQDELRHFFAHDDTDYQRWQYVISESKSASDVWSFFNMRKIRESKGML